MDRGRLTLGGALDLLDLSGGAQLLVTPLLLICIDPHQPRRSLWTVSMRHVLCAHIPSQDERVELSHLIQVSCIHTCIISHTYEQHSHVSVMSFLTPPSNPQLAQSRRGQEESGDDGVDDVLGGDDGGGEGVLVLITCCNHDGEHGTRVPLGQRPAALYRSDLANHVRVIESASLVSHLVLCGSMRAAQRLQRTLKTLFQLFDPSSDALSTL